jgi:pimeloyl-ACP methyl ester carboxylesterase/AcrR family transcriptional regulator
VEVVRANGLDIAYDRVGAGPPLVFVHGAAEDGRVWRPQLAALADEFTVVAWDEPGTGRSSDVPAEFGLPDYASCLATLIDTLALGPAHVAGLSWGGTVVLELYRHHPELVATLILVDTYAGWKGSLPDDELRARVAGAQQMLAAPAAEFDPTLPGLFAGDPPAEFVPLLEEIAAAVRPETLRTQLSVMAAADQRDLLPRITVPTLLVWGELDARSPLGIARQFEQAIPGAELVVIPQAGHVSHLERPERFNETVREFCRAHPPQAKEWRGTTASDRAVLRRARLIDAAFELVGEVGVEGTTVREVCRRAGLNPRYFYESFADLDALLGAVFDDVLAQTTAVVLEAIEAAPEDERAKTRAAIGTWIRHLTDDPRRIRLLVAEAMGNPVLAARRSAMVGAVADAMADQAAAFFGLRRDARLLRSTTHMLAGGVFELLIAWHDGSLELSVDALIDDASALVSGTGDAARAIAAERGR